MAETKLDPATVANFVEFCDQQYEVFEPFTSAHDQDFKADLPAFGGAGGHSLETSAGSSRDYGPVYIHEPMRPDEFEEAHATLHPDEDRIELDLAEDPGGAIPTWQLGFKFWGGEFLHDRNVMAWQTFYECGGQVSGGEVRMDHVDLDAPWAAPLKKTWDDAVDDRLEEVKVVRDELAYLIVNLMRSSMEIAEVDIANSIDVDLAAYEYVEDGD